MSKYTDLITNYHAGKPKFVEHVDLSTRPLIEVSTATSGLITAFDVDTAVGDQLDILGKWIGVSRAVAAPITGVFLQWDKERVGWDQGIWLGPYQSTDALTYLSDDVYRVVLKARIGINNWNGQNGTLPDILETALEGTGIKMIILDNQDMSISVLIVVDDEYIIPNIDRLIFDSAINHGPFIPLPEGYEPSRYDINPIDKLPAEFVFVIRAGLLTVKAAGVRIRETITPSNGYKFFGFDADNDYIAGFDAGAWGETF
ncbi:TPA: DUF2612 domain-containing protein [Klebsiella pneumoniae]|uniref:DUF2612 domain-containing protein n=1 Tax=Klebsiella TaxID=570 RepID=UPI0004729054|nr:MULTISPECIES: DUF2612 domain-containing protein [Klebsiella]HAV2047612.1 DUF2612 domain-containing protein [Raoultella ornithinolytica]EKV8731066.1 DUF2612 domain-containing protein [Klebsiella pneumoniae]EKX8502816.1 DUF2612 domain-containing protein [Klebsiella pneumoniae]EKZ6688326.1 DUF2612 domain-containing protein [Klebsiella pneumoniae]ELA2466874.1 DUF2612 domain-containing protein [Klebsiella pneumoniae]